MNVRGRNRTYQSKGYEPFVLKPLYYSDYDRKRTIHFLKDTLDLLP